MRPPSGEQPSATLPGAQGTYEESGAEVPCRPLPTPVTAMKKSLLVATAIVLSLASSRSVAAQSTVAESAPPARAACDSVQADCIKLSAAADSALREVERAAIELAKAVEHTVRQTANDPALRLSAMKLAAGALAVAHQALVQNAVTMEKMLAEAARQIASAQAALEARAEASGKP